MPASLDALQTLRSGPSTLNASDPYGVVAARLRKEDALLQMKRSLEMQSEFPGRVISGATHADVEDEQNQLDESPNFGVDAQRRTNDVLDTNQEMSTYSRPDVTEQRNTDYAHKLALVSAPAVEAAKGNLAVENAKTTGKIQEMGAQNDATAKLLDLLGGGNKGSGGIAGPGGSIKPTVNASGGVSFTTTQMPALVQRAHSQLSEAHEQHMEALHEAERLWPGVNDAAVGADAGTAPGLGSSLLGWLSGATGIGAQKYAGPSDAAALASETYRYRSRQPSPLSNFIQKASFGNLEQMAGQLPGVRGLATVVPLFRDHQTALTSNNPGTPLATVQRLRHLIDSEESALQKMQSAPEEFMAGYTGKEQ